MTRTDAPGTWTIGLDDPEDATGLVDLPDEPGEVVCRSLLPREGAMLEVGVSESRGPASVYLVAVEHCTHLSPLEARATAGRLLRAADDAEQRLV